MIHIMDVYGKWQLADIAVYLLIYEPHWASSTEKLVKEREQNVSDLTGG